MPVKEPRKSFDIAAPEEIYCLFGGTHVTKNILIADNDPAAVKCMQSIRRWSSNMFGTEGAIRFFVMSTHEDLAANEDCIKLADQCVPVPGGSNNNNYTSVDLIAAIAKRIGADAVFAGWDRASENSQLLELLAKLRISFMGPPRRTPLIDGLSSSNVGADSEMTAVAQAGGRGPWKCECARTFPACFREEPNEFPKSLVSKELTTKARHRKVKFLSDNSDSAISERHCSVQRRHRKIVEEDFYDCESEIELEKDRSQVRVTEQPSDTLGTWHWKDVVWGNVFKLGLLHIFAIWGCFVWSEMKWQTTVFGLIWLQLSGLSVTMGAHRLWCHRAYKAKLPLRIALMLMNCIAAQNDLYEWVRDHRVHHKYSDTNADPHNISRGLFFSHMGWLFVKKHPDVMKFGKRLDCSDVIADPVVRFQRKYYGRLVIFFAFLIPTYLPLLWGESLRVAFLVPTCLRLIASLHFTWSVNSWAHYFGDRPFDSEMKPTETALVSIWAVGEGFHNFHHVFPYDYACSELGWFMNTSTMLIDFMAVLGQAYDRRSVTKETILKKKLASGDGSRLPASIKENRTLALDRPAEDPVH